MNSAIAFSVAGLVLVETVWRRTDFFSPFRLFLFFHSLTYGIAYLELVDAMTPFRPLTNMVYFGSGACFLLGTLCVAGAASDPGRPHSRPSLLDKDGYDWGRHFRFSLALFAFFLTGMFIAYRGVGAFPLLADDKLDVMNRFLSYHWSSNIPINYASLTLALFFMIAVSGRYRLLGLNVGLWMTVLTGLIFSLTMSRSSLIFFAFFALAYYHYTVRRLSLVKLGLIFGLLFAGFLGIAYHKLEESQRQAQMSSQSTARAAKALLMIPYVYVANNFWNLDYALNPENHQVRHKPTYGFTTVSGFFDMIYTGSFWGHEYRESLDYEDIFHKKTQKVRHLNTVTFQWGLYKDFGMLGVMLVPFGFGILVSLLYWKVRRTPTVFNVGSYSFFAFMIGFSWFLAFWESQIYLYGLFYLTAVLAFCQRRTAPPESGTAGGSGAWVN